MFNSSRNKFDWSKKHERTYNEILKSSLFNSNFLTEFYLQKRFNPVSLYTMHTLKRFHDFYVLGEKSFLPRRFVRKIHF